MKIAFYECEDWEQEYFQEKLDHECVFVEGGLTNDNLVEDADAIVVFIYSHVPAETIDRCSNLKLICTRSTGFDHIDIAHAHKKGIVVSNVPFYGQNTVAEHTMALLLAISRNIIPSVQRVQGGSFEAQGLKGFDLKGKTMGVIGSGHIGRHVIRMANGFEMNVLAYDPHPHWEMQDQFNFRYVGLDELLAESDVVTLHCPYNEQTHHILNEGNLSIIKKGAIVLNTARGALIDSAALLRGLNEGRIAGAGLDVLEEEKHIKEERQILSQDFHSATDMHKMLLEHVLIHHPRVLVTPHNAFNSTEALYRILDTTIENIQGFESGDPANKVD